MSWRYCITTSYSLEIFLNVLKCYQIFVARVEMEFWKRVISSVTIYDLRDFEKRFPSRFMNKIKFNLYEA